MDTQRVVRIAMINQRIEVVAMLFSHKKVVVRIALMLFVVATSLWARSSGSAQRADHRRTTRHGSHADREAVSPPSPESQVPTMSGSGGCTDVDIEAHARRLRSVAGLAVIAAAEGTCSSLTVARHACREAYASAQQLRLILEACIGATVEGGDASAFLVALDAMLPPEALFADGWCPALLDPGGHPEEADQSLEQSLAIAATLASRASAEDALATARRVAPSCEALSPTPAVATP